MPSQWFELVRIDLDARSEWGLEQGGIGCGDSSPAEGVQVGGERAWVVEGVATNPGPKVFRDDRRVQLRIPQKVETLALGVVLDTGEAHQGRVSRTDRAGHVFDQPMPVSGTDEHARRRNWDGHVSLFTPDGGSTGGTLPGRSGR